MEPVTGLPKGGDKGQDAGEFFIPDLCTPRSVLFMVLLSELLVILYTLASSALPLFDWELLATTSLFVLWIVLLSAALLCLMRDLFSRLGLVLATAGSLAVVLAVTALSSQAALLLYPQSGHGLDPVWWVLRNLLVALVLAGIVLRNFYLQHQLRLREKLELLARLDALRSRIRPHFLFNTLNSIASLIMSRPEAAEQAVEDLSELFRASLQDDARPATVGDEVHLCELYLGIEKLRLGERLDTLWEVDPVAAGQQMPSLILQPLVENAVYHGISRLPAGGVVKIRVAIDGAMVRATVENPVHSGEVISRGNNMALANIEQRLHALYDGEGGLRVGREGETYRVELFYPMSRVA